MNIETVDRIAERLGETGSTLIKYFVISRTL